MTIVRRVARPLLAATFVQSGVEAFRHPAPHVEKAKPLVSKAAPQLRLPDDPELLVRAHGAATAGAGLLLGLNRFPRLSSLVLAASIVPTAYVQHPFWEAKDPVTKRTQRTDFLKSMGLLGGVLIAAVDTEGRPGIAWRTRRAAKDAARATRVAKKEARMAAKQAKREAKRAVHVR